MIMSIRNHIYRAIKKGSFRRLKNLLTLARRLERRRQIAQLPNFLKPNWKIHSTVPLKSSPYRFHDAARMRFADGEIYIWPDGQITKCRARKPNAEVSGVEIPVVPHR